MADNKASIIFDLVDKASAGLKNLRGSLVGVADTALKAQARAELLQTRLEGLGKAGQALAIGAGATAAALGFFGLTALKASGQFEQWSIAFETMLGSSEKAKIFMGDLVELAKKTPFKTSEVIEQSKALLAMGIATEDIIPSIEMLGNISAGVGVDKLPQLTLAYGQVRSATRLTGNELRQFTEAGVPLLEVLAKTLNKSTAEVQGMVREGKIGFTDVRNALASLTGEGGKFFNLMEKQSASLGGKWSNLTDIWAIFLKKIGDDLAPVAKFFIEAFTKIIGIFSDMNPTLRAMIVSVAGVVAVFATFGTGLGLFLAVLPSVVAGFAVLSGALAAVGVSVSFALVGIPLLVAGFAALSVAIIRNWDSVRIFSIGVAKEFIDFGRNFLLTVQIILDKLNSIAAKIPGIPKVNLNVNGAIASLDALSSKYDASMKKIGTEKAIKSAVKADVKPSGDIFGRGFIEKVGNAKSGDDGKEAREAAEKAAKEAERIEKEVRSYEKIMAAHKASMEAKKANDTYNLANEISTLDIILATHKFTEEEILKLKTERSQRQQELNTKTGEDELLILQNRLADADMGGEIALNSEISRQERDLAGSNLTAEQKKKKQLEIDKLKRDQSKKEYDFHIGVVQQLGDTSLSIEKQLANASLNQGRALANSEIDQIAATEATKLSIVGAAKLGVLDFVGAGIAFAQVAGIYGLAAAAKTGLNSIKLAEGGVVMPRNGGTLATVGEAGQPEAVIPLDRLSEFIGGGETTILLHIDGEQVAKSTYKHTKRLERSGQLSGGI